MVETMRTETLAAWLEAALDQGSTGSTGSTPLSDLSLWSLRPGPHSAAGALPAMQSDAVAHFPRTVGFSRPTGAQAQRWQRWQISKNADLNTLPCCVGLKSELFHAGTHSARPVTGRQQLWWNFQGLSQVFDVPHHWYWRHRTVCRFRKWSMGHLYPPSQCAFTSAIKIIITSLPAFLRATLPSRIHSSPTNKCI